MSIELFIRAPLGLLPVLIFLAVLQYMDSYKLVALRAVVVVIVAGAVALLPAYLINGYLLDALTLDLQALSRYVSPVIEELLKALVILYLFRSHCIGFLVDAAIMGFAVGAGFAVAENFYYLYIAGNAPVAVWIVRGFGTAIMHGGVTAIVAIVTQTVSERSMRVGPLHLLPGLGIAITLHSLFNHFVLPPILMTLSILLLLPPILYGVFGVSAARLHDWLELDFDADTRLLQQIDSGEFADSRIGRYLGDLRRRFDGPLVADMLCYLRVYTELALRAKGLLLMRENGLEVSVGERTREKFAELDYLERSIGKTGILAMRPFLHMTRKDLWQMNVLDT